MYNILIYFCNIKIKHLQCPDKTLETYFYNIGFAWTRRHAGTEVDNGAWTSLCGNGTGNSLVGAASHEACPPRLLVGASVMEARRLDGDGRG
jgi:hypothetical protein